MLSTADTVSSSYHANRPKPKQFLFKTKGLVSSHCIAACRALDMGANSRPCGGGPLTCSVGLLENRSSALLLTFHRYSMKEGQYSGSVSAEPEVPVFAAECRTSSVTSRKERIQRSLASCRVLWHRSAEVGDMAASSVLISVGRREIVTRPVTLRETRRAGARVHSGGLPPVLGCSAVSRSSFALQTVGGDNRCNWW